MRKAELSGEVLKTCASDGFDWFYEVIIATKWRRRGDKPNDDQMHTKHTRALVDAIYDEDCATFG